MENEKDNKPMPNPAPEKDEGNNPYIEQMAKLKANSVSKEAYEKLKADNKQMLEILFSGAAPAPSQGDDGNKEPKIDKEARNAEIQALRDELYGGRYEGTDLDYATKTLKLRKLLMDSGKPDPAVSSGQKTAPEEYDYENCQSVCDQIQECIDYADGDDALFRAELMRRVNKK